MNKIEYLKDKLYKHRNILNPIAECGRKEYKTASYIREQLDQMNVAYETYLDTATVGIIKGKNPKKTIAFRADIDGLITENGVRHLCGHDGHTTILLGLVEFLNDNKEKLNDNIVFIFQPAEEGPGGAEALIEAGVLKDYNVDEIYGLHIYPEIQEGYVGTRPGYFLAQVGDIDIDIIAKSGHGAMPQNAIDGIVIAANFISNLQTIVSRNISPIDNAVLTMGKIQGGSRRNIIAENIRIEGSLRAFHPEIYSNIKKRINELARGFELAYNCKINVNVKDDYISVKNDKNLYDEFIEAVGDRVIELDPLMISEDFSYYQREVPGLFFMLGSRNEEKGFTNGLHSLNFNFNEDIFINALNVYIDLLKHKKSIDTV